MGAAAAQTAASAVGAEAEVLQAEDAFRVAKLKNDTAALKALLADGYIGINQYGVIRNKAELLELFQTFPLTLLHSDQVTVRISGDTAVLTGQQMEKNPAGVEKHVFSRTYVRRSGRWQLLSSTQLIPFNPS